MNKYKEAIIQKVIKYKDEPRKNFVIRCLKAGLTNADIARIIETSPQNVLNIRKWHKI